MGKDKVKPEQSLMTAIGFTEEDLEANQAGKISVAQHADLRKESRDVRWAVFAFLVIGGGTFICLTLVEPLGYVPGFLMGVIPVVAAIFLATRWPKTNRDIQIGKVRSIEGRIHLDVASGGKSSVFSLTVGAEKFVVNKVAFLAFKNGDPYIIYYMPHSRTILSAEWLRD